MPLSLSELVVVLVGVYPSLARYIPITSDERILSQYLVVKAGERQLGLFDSVTNDVHLLFSAPDVRADDNEESADC